jgi:hypothetical protein
VKKILVSLFAVALIASLANAGEVTEFSDTFTGADGTIVAPGAMWGYTNIGMEINNWNTYPRPSAADLYVISNNQLHMYVGPTVSNVPVYNKLQAAIIPGSYADPTWLTFTNGQIELSMDVMASYANAGNMWGFSKETKPTLNSVNNPVDNGGGSDHYRFQIQVGPNDLNIAQQVSVQGAGPSGNFNLAIGNDVALPVALKLVVEADSTVKIYTNGLLITVTNGLVDPVDIQTVYPFIWDGMFNGAGGVDVDAYLEIDNYNVKWTPEPGMFALLALALPLLRKLG